MRTLKKTLALVLVLAMMFSLCITASADFTDDAEIEYVEAVDVLTAIGVIDGMPDGSFDPTGTLTRAQAAKIVVYLLGAEDLATATVASFDDVAADYWAASYIAYCVEEGIIAGYGDGTFGPEDALTGYQWAKMLLVALGFDADDYTGSAWQIAVAKDAVTAELFEGNADANKTVAATREEACLYALNAINYGTEETVYEVSATNKDNEKTSLYFESYNDAIIYIAITENTEYVGTATQYDDTILETVHGVMHTDTTDTFGRPADVYYDIDTEGDELYLLYVDTPAAVYTSAAYEKTIYSDLGDSGIGDGSAAKYIEIDKTYVDGEPVSSGITGNDADNKITKNKTSEYGGTNYGTTVEFYKVKTNHYIRVIVNEYIGTVTGVVAASSTNDTDRYITIDSAYTFVTEDYAKADVVLYTKKGSAAKSVTEPETVSGTVTKVTNGAAYTINGETYVLSANADDVEIGLGVEGTWYLDSCGNIIANKSVSDVDYYYGYLLDYEFSDYSSSSLLGDGGSEAAEKVKFVDASGNEVTFDTAFDTDSDGKIERIAPDTWEKNPESGFLFSYTLNADGEITGIYDAKKTSGNEYTLYKGVAKLSGSALALTDETVFFFVDADGDYAVYTGYTNIPTSTTGKLSYTVTDDGEMMALVLEVDSVSTSSSAEYVYFASAAYTSEYTEDGTVYTYTNVYINGEYAENGLAFGEALSVAAGDVWEYTVSSDDNLADLGTEIISGSYEGVEVTKLYSTYFIAGDVVYTDDDTVYYEIDMTNGTIEVVTGLTALSSNDAYSVKLLYADSSTAADNATSVVFYYVGE